MSNPSVPLCGTLKPTSTKARFSHSLKRLGLCLAALSLGAFAAQGEVLPHPENLIPDSGFEGGLLQDPFSSSFKGSLFIDTTEALTGNASLRLTANHNNAYTAPWRNSPDAAVAAISGEQAFELSAWVKADSAASQVKMFIFCLDETYEYLTYPFTSQGFTVGTDWSPVSMSHSCPAGSKFASVRLQVSVAGTTTWWDDVSLRRISDGGSNLLANGGFEGPALIPPFANAWQGSLTRDPGTKYVGNYALRHDSTSTDSFTLPYRIEPGAGVVALDGQGGDFELSAWAKAATADTQAQLRIFCLDAAYEFTSFPVATQTASLGTDWQRVAVEHSCDPAAKFVAVRLDTDGVGSTIWWDEVRLSDKSGFVNRIPDPDFESGVLRRPFANAFQGTLAIDSAESLTGDYSLRLTATQNNDGFTAPYQGSSDAALIALDGETPLRLSAWAKADAAGTPVQMRIICLSSTYVFGVPTGLLSATVDTDWQRLELEHTCPETAAFASLRLDVDQNGRSVWWDQMAFGRSPSHLDVLKEHYAIYVEAQDQSFGQMQVDFLSFDHYDVSEMAGLNTLDLHVFDPSGQFGLQTVTLAGPSGDEAAIRSVWRSYTAEETQAWNVKRSQAPSTVDQLATLVESSYSEIHGGTFTTEAVSSYEISAQLGSSSSTYRAMAFWLRNQSSSALEYLILDPVLVGVENIEQRLGALDAAMEAQANQGFEYQPQPTKSGNPQCKADPFTNHYRYNGQSLEIDYQTTGVALPTTVRKTDAQGHTQGNHYFEGAVDLTCQCYENCDNVAVTQVRDVNRHETSPNYHAPGCHGIPLVVASDSSIQTGNDGNAVWGKAAMGSAIVECNDFGIYCHCEDVTVGVTIESNLPGLLIEGQIGFTASTQVTPLKMAVNAQCPACTKLFNADVTVRGLANGASTTVTRSYLDEGQHHQASKTVTQFGTEEDDISVTFDTKVPDGVEVTFDPSNPACGKASSNVRGEDLSLTIQCNSECTGTNGGPECDPVPLGGMASGIDYAEYVTITIDADDGQSSGKLVGSNGFFPLNMSAHIGTGFTVEIRNQSNEAKECTLTTHNSGVVGEANTNNGFFKAVTVACECPSGETCDDPTPPAWEDSELRELIQEITPPPTDLWPFDVGIPAPNCNYECPENMEPTWECTDVYDDEGNFLYEDCTLEQPTCKWNCDFGSTAGPTILGSTYLATQPNGLELLTIDVTARDNEDGVDGFLIFIDGELVKGVQTPEGGATGSMNATLDVSDYPDGNHELVILALDDAQGNQTPTMEVLTFETTAGAGPCASDSAGPGLSVLPSAGSVLPPGPVSIQAFADDENLVDRVKIWIDGQAQTLHSEPWIRSWNATPGVHDIMVRAWDSCGNFRTLSYQLTVQADCTNDSTYPTVTLDSPAHGASLTEGVVTLEATASDANGISAVQFKVGGTVIGTDSVAPYTFDWAATPGRFSVTAKAIDGCNLAATSSAHTVTITEEPADCSTDNVGPVVQISSPVDGGQLTAGQTVTLAATANDTSGVERVQFFVDDMLLSADLWAPYQGSWNPSPGLHTLKARGIDHCGNMRSQEITVTVGDEDGCDVDSTNPSVGWISPLQGDLVTPGTVQLQASAADANGIDKVQFFVDGSLLAADHDAPFSLPWQAAPGDYTLKARAIDTCGRMASSEISITVGQANACDTDQVLPTISVTSPADGASLSPGQIALNANASDANGVEKVQFFVNDALIGADFTAPYATTWTAPPGSHTIKARATDMCGNLKAQEIDVTVGDPAGCDADSTKPWINLVTPAAGSSLNAGTPVSLSAQASDDSGIDKVQFFVDGSLIGADHTAPYELMWNPSPGDHEVKARALDTCGNLKADIHIVNAQ